MGVTALRHKDATCPFYLTVTMCRGECNQCLFMYQCMSEIGCVFCNCTQECVCVDVGILYECVCVCVC